MHPEGISTDVRSILHVPLVLCRVCVEQVEADEERRLAEEEPQQWAMSFADRHIYDNVRCGLAQFHTKYSYRMTIFLPIGIGRCFASTSADFVLFSRKR